MTKGPAPISWPPSEYWDGDDGPWSSFALRVGSPEQTVRVLPSTAGQATWAVIPQGCPASGLANCSQTRGGLFDFHKSSSWKNLGNYSMGLEQNLGFDEIATYGQDTVALGFSDATGTHAVGTQIVTGFETDDYYTGMFGLNHQGMNLTNLTDYHPTFLTTIRSQNLIPSLSWAYTAGAPYRLKGVFGSLTLGGYDSSRFIPNNVPFSLAPDISRDIVVGLQSITSIDANGSSTSLLPSAILTLIDSTQPYIYLPVEACQAFEQAFGLTYNATAQTYWVNDTLHQSLMASNPNITFQIGDSQTGGPTVDIVLPYASFDLTATYPYAVKPTRYFPLARAANESQYTLGRTFLQEAYLITNYEQSNFSVSQANFQPGLKESIILIPSATHSSHISRATIISVSVGATAFLALCVLAIVFGVRVWRYRHRRNGSSDATEPENPFQDKQALDDFAIHEIDNNSLCGYREVPDSGKVELLDGTMPSGSGNKILEMAHSSVIVVHELMTHRDSGGTTREITDSEKAKLPDGKRSWAQLPQSLTSLVRDLTTDRKSTENPKDIRESEKIEHLGRRSPSITEYEPPQSPPPVVHPLRPRRDSNGSPAVQSHYHKSRFGIFVSTGISARSSDGTSSDAPGVQTRIYSLPRRKSIDLDRSLPPTPISESPQTLSPVMTTFNISSRFSTRPRLITVPRRQPPVCPSAGTSPAISSFNNRFFARQKFPMPPQRAHTGSSTSGTVDSYSLSTPGGDHLSPITPVGDYPSPVKPNSDYRSRSSSVGDYAPPSTPIGKFLKELSENEGTHLSYSSMDIEIAIPHRQADDEISVISSVDEEEQRREQNFF